MIRTFCSRAAALLLAVLVISAPASAASIFDFDGNFSRDDTAEQFRFSISAPTTVTMRTLSFAGGVNASGDKVEAGGFAPVLSLFGPEDELPLLASDHNGGPGSCGPRQTDPISGFCWDSFIRVFLNPGFYRLVLTQDDNLPLGAFLADGFLRTGEGNFTGPQFRGSAGSFILVDGTQRTSDWAVEINGADEAALVSEPSTLSLLLSAGLLLAGAGIRRRARFAAPMQDR